MRKQENRAAVKEKEKLALQLKLSGHSYEVITARCGYLSQSAAWKAVNRAIKDIPREAAEEMRQVEAQRLDAMIAAVWKRACRGDTVAIDEVLKVTTARARLFGLNKEAEQGSGLVIQKAYIGVPIEEL